MKKISISFASILILFAFFFFGKVSIFFKHIFMPFVFFYFRRIMIYIVCILMFFDFFFFSKILIFLCAFRCSILFFSFFFFCWVIFCFRFLYRVKKNWKKLLNIEEKIIFFLFNNAEKLFLFWFLFLLFFVNIFNYGR